MYHQQRRETMYPAVRNVTNNPMLENMIEDATNPARHEPDFALCLEICDLIKQKGKGWPRDAALAIVRRVNSPYQQQALLSMSLLDMCVKNCGYPFHLQIATKDFLNEFVRRFPASPPVSLTPMQWKILEFIQQWNATLCEHSRYKDDLRHINDMHRLLSFKGYRFPGFNQADAAAVIQENQLLKSEQELEEEDRQAQEAKLHELLRRATPADLVQANELMKTLAGYDEENRPDYKKKVEEDLEKIEHRAMTLNDTLNALSPGTKPDPTTQESYAQCKSSLLRIQKLITSSEDANDRTERLLYLNDLLNHVISAYDDLKAGRPRSNSPAPVFTKTEQGVQTTQKKQDSLIDFEDEPVATSDKTTGSLIDDLAGLSFGQSNPLPFGQGGSITLGSTPFSNGSKPASPSLQPAPPTIKPSSPKPISPKPSTQPAIAPGPEKIVIEKNGLKVTLRKLGNGKYQLSMYNAIPVAFENFSIQAAVPKSMQISLDPLSSSTISPMNKEPVTQSFKITKSNASDQEKLKYRISYTIAGTEMKEEGSFGEFSTL